MLVVLRFRASDEMAVSGPLAAAQSVLAGQAGFTRGWIARSPDERSEWLLVSQWADVGSMRRGLGSAAAKMALGPLQPYAADASGAYEVLQVVEDGHVENSASARAADADSAGPGASPHGG